MAKAKIVWNGQGGELDSKVVELDPGNEYVVRDGLIELLQGNIVNPGDSIEIVEVSE